MVLFLIVVLQGNIGKTERKYGFYFRIDFR